MGGGSLNFRASEVLSQAELAFANFSDEDKSLGASGAVDDGLEISKLGISGEIVQALAKKGITKLFPIQVHFHFTIVRVIYCFFPKIKAMGCLFFTMMYIVCF